jgi:hypothetical protein
MLITVPSARALRRIETGAPRLSTLERVGLIYSMNGGVLVRNQLFFISSWN